jgi:hypothetical protein
MKLGQRLYQISRRRRAVIGSLVLAFVACLFTLYRPTFLPPSLHSRTLAISSASTELLVSSPNLAVGNSYDYESLVNSSTLVGNEMVGGQVLAEVGRAVGVSPSQIQGTAPMTANVPRTLIEPGSGGFATDLLAAPDHYKLEIQADPAAPILHVYTQAPTAHAAEVMATAAINGVTTYLQQTQTAANIRPNQQIHVQQLGPVQGGVANPGAGKEIAGLVFFGVFCISLFVIAILDQIRRGWQTARFTEQLQP